MKKNILLFIAILASKVVAAHDFALPMADGQKLYFNITDTVKAEVELTYPGSIKDAHPGFNGALTIPQKISYNKKTYSVTAIGAKAFAGNKNLTAVTMPSGLREIGDFAFMDCTALTRVLMPGNMVKIGSGAFFRCGNISTLSIGSDWTKFDMSVFRWTDKIKEITIPARVTSILHYRSMRGLEAINVDGNNTHYASVDGLLYNKDKTELLICPRGRKGAVELPEGTTSIRWGAMSQSRGITDITLPATLQKLSYKEFAQMRSLNRIVMKNPQPVNTAEIGGKKYFLLTLANPSAYVVVAKKSLKDYQKALATTAGDYRELSENLPKGMEADRHLVPLVVKTGDMLTTAHIVGAKDFDKLDKVKPKK